MADTDPAELERQIERTRAELARRWTPSRTG